jgi:hypothetical protein
MMCGASQMMELAGGFLDATDFLLHFKKWAEWGGRGCDSVTCCYRGLKSTSLRI